MPDYNRKPKSRAAALLALPTLLIGLLPACDPGPTGQSTDQSPGISTNTPPTPIAAPPVDTNAVFALNDEQIQFDKTVFANEVDAQAYESTFVALWDRLRSMDPFKVFRKFSWEFLQNFLRIPQNSRPDGKNAAFGAIMTSGYFHERGYRQVYSR